MSWLLGGGGTFQLNFNFYSILSMNYWIIDNSPRGINVCQEAYVFW